MEEDVTLLIISPPNPDKVFWKKSKKVPFTKKLAQMMTISANGLDSKTKQKGINEYIQCDFLKEFISENNDDVESWTCSLWLCTKLQYSRSLSDMSTQPLWI